MKDQTATNKVKLMPNQMALWLGQQMYPGVPLYNTAATYEIRGPLNPELFQQAFQHLINHTDALRFQFHEENGRPLQSVMPHLDYELEVLDGNQVLVDQDVKSYAISRTQRPLDLSKQVFDSCLIAVDAKIFVWYINLHHLVTDGISRLNLFQRLQNIYGQLRKGVPVDVPESASLLDYVSTHSMDIDGRNESNTYWDTKRSNSVSPPMLYGKKSDSDTKSFTRIHVPVGKKRTKALKGLAQRPEYKSWTADSSLMNLLTGILFAYIHRVSGQDKIAIGMPIHNRLQKRFRNTVGYFVELFPLTLEVKNDQTFDRLVQAVRAETFETLKVAVNGSAPPDLGKYYHVVMNYIPTRYADFDGMDVRAEWIPSGHMEPNHSLRCHISDYEGSGDLEIYLDINNSLLDPNLAQRIPEHFLALMDTLITNPESRIGKPELSLFQEKEKLEVAVDWQPNHQIIPKSLSESFSAHQNQIGLRHGDRSWEYGVLDTHVQHLANILAKRGVQLGDRIAIHQFRSPEYVVSVLAAIRIGATFVPIASDQAAARTSFILKDSDCKLVLTQGSLEQNIPTEVPTLTVDLEDLQGLSEEDEPVDRANSINAHSIVYVLYTSGSTGNPKGVLISYEALSNYLNWALEYYRLEKEPFVFPLFTNIGFDLTITSIFLPLLSGGELIVYKENVSSGADFSVLDVIRDNRVNTIKLTPSHIRLILTESLEGSKLQIVIVGGEDFRSATARALQGAIAHAIHIYNEYGPTEATIGCIAARYDSEKHTGDSVPIGRPIRNTKALLLDTNGNTVPQGVPGELYVGGIGLAQGYLNLPELTTEKFVTSQRDGVSRLYRTGDLVRINSEGDFEFIGRIDDQVKHNGMRIELADIEAQLEYHPGIKNSSVVLLDQSEKKAEPILEHCAECGLPSNFPNADFDSNSICHLCNAFKNYSDKVQPYFKSEDELRNLLLSGKSGAGKYDCLSLLSGGKDSTYVLARLADMGLKVLAFTLDNGYISDQAKANVDRIVGTLGVDHVYGSTEHMNAIFVDSLHRHANVCNGCFKTIYTLSAQIALEYKIPFIVTGLSRGQFFETRLTEELFWENDADTDSIDATILEARKIYHQEDDAVKKLLDVSIFQNDKTFEKVQFVDFYRYCDVKLEDMLRFLKAKTGWKRPTDTGRSTNCLINQVGIYVHKNRKGYSNYAFPYSWDVRLGHKNREESLEEINEEINVGEVKRIIEEIGYDESQNSATGNILVGYYSGPEAISEEELREYLATRLPRYMIPDAFYHLETFPLTPNGKIDKKALQQLGTKVDNGSVPYEAPRNEFEELIAAIWQEVLQRDQIGIQENFISLGGHSLAAIRVTARLNKELELDLKLSKIFEFPTIEQYSNYIEQTIRSLLNT